jgi:hypothetical protein
MACEEALNTGPHFRTLDNDSCLDKERPRGKRLVVGLKGVAC